MGPVNQGKVYDWPKMETIKNNENPLYSLCFNILIPVMILKNGNKWIDRILIYYQGGGSVIKMKVFVIVPQLSFLLHCSFQSSISFMII